MGGARGATAVWSVAALAYLVAVVHRTALGVAGADAIDRFALGATGLATFSVMQLVVYAGLQIPAGRLLDRFGVRALVAAGSAVMRPAATPPPRRRPAPADACSRSTRTPGSG